MQRFGRLLPRLQQARGLLGPGGWAIDTMRLGLANIRGFADDANLLKTPLFDFHVENGGVSMPREVVQIVDCPT